MRRGRHDGLLDLERNREHHDHLGVYASNGAIVDQYNRHPGHVDSPSKSSAACGVLDGAILVLCAVGGVQSQSLHRDRQMKRYRIPASLHQQDGPAPARIPTSDCAGQGKARRHSAPAAKLPMGAESRFQGVIDLVRMQAVFFDGNTGEIPAARPIPEEYVEAAKAGRAFLLETLSLFDDRLMERCSKSARCRRRNHYVDR